MLVQAVASNGETIVRITRIWAGLRELNRTYSQGRGGAAFYSVVVRIGDVLQKQRWLVEFDRIQRID
jgi:hypothetical protein